MADPRIKTVKIKTGVVRRLAKEIVMYQKEGETQTQRIQKLKDGGADEHDIKKQEEVLFETLMIIPDCKKRLVVAHAELKALLESETDLDETDEYKVALTVLDETEIVNVGDS